MHEEHAGFHNAERSLVAKSGTSIRQAGVKRRDAQVAWCFPRRSWSLQPKAYTPAPWGARRKPMVAVAVFPDQELILKRMMDDPSISDDRSDQTAAASTLDGCVDWDVSILRRSRQQASGSRTTVGRAGLEKHGAAAAAASGPPSPSPQLPADAPSTVQQRRHVRRDTLRQGVSHSSRGGGGGGAVARAAQVTVNAVLANAEDDGGGSSEVLAGDGTAVKSGPPEVDRDPITEPGAIGKQLQLDYGGNGRNGHANCNGNGTGGGRYSPGQQKTVAWSVQRDDDVLLKHDGGVGGPGSGEAASQQGQLYGVGDLTAYLHRDLLIGQPLDVLEAYLIGVWSSLETKLRASRHARAAAERLRFWASGGRSPPPALRKHQLAERLAVVERAVLRAKATIGARSQAAAAAAAAGSGEGDSAAAAPAASNRCDGTAAVEQQRVAAAAAAGVVITEPLRTDDEAVVAAELPPNGGSQQHEYQHQQRNPSPSRSHVSGQFIPDSTAYLTEDLLLSPPEVVLERVEAAMRRSCTTYDNTRHHGGKATKMLQALAASGRLAEAGLEQRLEALGEAVRRVRRWLEVAPALVPEQLAVTPEEWMLGLQEMWRAKYAKSLQEVADCAAEELRRLVASGTHPVPELLAQQLEALDLLVRVRVRSPTELMLQTRLEEEEELETQQQQQEVAGGAKGQDTAAAVVQRRRRWLTSLLVAHWGRRVVRGISMAATELEDAMLDAFRLGALSRAALEVRLKIIANAKTEAVAAAQAEAEAAEVIVPESLATEAEGAVVAAAKGEDEEEVGDDKGGGGGRSAPAGHGRGGRNEYTGRVAYVTMWLVLQPPMVVCRAVADAVDGRGAVVLRFHRRWIRETARRAHGPGLLSDVQLDELIRAVDMLTPENLNFFLEGGTASLDEPPIRNRSGSDAATAAVHGGATAYLTQELLRLPAEDLKLALLREWQGRTRDSVRYHYNVVLRRIADLYSLRGGAVAGADAAAAAAAAAASNAAVEEAAKGAFRLYALARQERLTGLTVAAAAPAETGANASGMAAVSVAETEYGGDSGGSGGDSTESESEEPAPCTAAATAAGLGAGLQQMEPAVRAAVLGLLSQLPTADLPPSLSDPVVQHVLRNDLDEVTRTTQLADYIRTMGQNARSRLLLSVRRKLGRASTAGVLTSEAVAVAETVLRNAVVVLQLRANEPLMLLLTAPPTPPTPKVFTAATAGSADGGADDSNAVDAQQQVVEALMQGWVGLPLSHKNSHVQGLRRNLRRAMEVGLADATALRRAEELLRRASLQSYLVRNGYEAEEAAMAAAAGAAAAEEAKAAAAAVALPDAGFWGRAAADSGWGVEQLAEQWRPLGPMARKRLKRRMLHSLDRMVESTEIDSAVAQSGVAVMRHATLALAREWRSAVLEASSGGGGGGGDDDVDVGGRNAEIAGVDETFDEFHSPFSDLEATLEKGDCGPAAAAAAATTITASAASVTKELGFDTGGTAGGSRGSVCAKDDGDNEEQEEALEVVEDESGGNGSVVATRRAARRKSPYFLRAAELAVLPPKALYDSLMEDLAAIDYISRKRLLERTREQVRARFDSGGLTAAALRKMLTSIAAASSAVGRSKMRAAAQRVRGGRGTGTGASGGASPASLSDDDGEAYDSEEVPEEMGGGGDDEEQEDMLEVGRKAAEGAAGSSGDGRDGAGGGGGSGRSGRWRRTVTNALTPEQEAALPRAWEAIRTKSLLQPPEELQAALEAAWVPLDAHSHRNHHHYGRERLRQLRDSGLLSPQDYATRMVAMAAAARRARLARGEVLAKPRGRCTALHLVAAVGGSDASGDGGAAFEQLSPVVAELQRVRTALLDEYETDPDAFRATAKEVRLDIKMGVGRNRSPALIVPVAIPGCDGGGGAALPPPPVAPLKEPWLAAALGINLTSVLRVWATIQWRPYNSALKDNLEQLRVLLAKRRTAGGIMAGGRGTAATTLLSPLDEQCLAAGEAELTLWYQHATILRSQLHQLAMSKSRTEREKAARAAAAAAAAAGGGTDGAGGAYGPKLPRLSTKEQALCVMALQGRLAAAGVDLTEPEEVPLELKSVYGRPPSALEHQAAVAAVSTTAEQGVDKPGAVEDASGGARRVGAAGGGGGSSPWVIGPTEELVAAGQRAEAAMDDRAQYRLAMLQREQPTIAQLLAPTAALRKTVIDFFKSSGGEKSTGQKQLAAHRLRRRLDQLRSWGVIGPKRHVTQVAVVQQVSSAWPYLLRGASLDENGHVVLMGLEGEDEVNKTLGTMPALQLQLWLLNRWRPLTPVERRMDCSVLRWRLRRLRDRGLISTEVFDAQRDAVGVVSARWRQLTEEGLTLDAANKMGRRHGRSGRRARIQESNCDANATTDAAADDIILAPSGNSSSIFSAVNNYEWVRKPRRSRAEVAAERAAAATRPKLPRGRPRVQSNVHASESRVKEADLQAAYDSIIESDNGKLDPALQSLVASSRQSVLDRPGSTAPGYAAGVMGKRLNQWRWLSRATMPDAVAAASGLNGTVIDGEATAVEATALAEVPLDVLTKVARLQQLVRQQRANLRALQLTLQAPSQAPVSDTWQGQQQQQQPQVELAGVNPAAMGATEAQLATARTVVQRAEARLAEWRQHLPPDVLEYLDKLAWRQQLAANKEAAGEGVQGDGLEHPGSQLVNGHEGGRNFAHSGNGVVNDIGGEHGRMEDNGGDRLHVALNDCDGDGSNLAGSGASSKASDVVADVRAEGYGVTVGGTEGQHHSAASVVAAAAITAAAVSVKPLNWMDAARRGFESHVAARNMSAVMHKVDAKTAPHGNGNGNGNGRSQKAVATADATATARDFPTSYPLESADGSDIGSSDDSLIEYSGWGNSSANNTLPSTWGSINNDTDNDALSYSGKSDVEVEADLHLNPWRPESAVEIEDQSDESGCREMELSVDLKALRSKYFSSAPPLIVFQKAQTASDGRRESGGAAAGGSQHRHTAKQHRSRRVRK